ncbi:MAG: DUF4886 domain-containing protein [Elusimicrobiota bacterium]
MTKRSLFFAAMLVPSCAAGARAAHARVLFLGNSFTYVNDLPGTLRLLAASRGDAVEAKSSTAGGWGFAEHAGDPATPGKIGAEPWDFVVLQEQSQRASFRDEQVESGSMRYAVQLADMVRAARKDSRVIVYGTWAPRDGDAANCKPLPELCTYGGAQERLDASLAWIARRVAASLAPAGTAWRAVRAAHPGIDLYGGDGKHPSPAGTYLAACVFYGAIFGKPSAGAAPVGVDPATARILQDAADLASAAVRY